MYRTSKSCDRDGAKFNLEMEGVTGVSVVQGVSTKDHEIKLDKYRESGSLIEKGCTTDTTVTDDSVPTTRTVCARSIAKGLSLLPKKYGKRKNSIKSSKRPHTGRAMGTPSCENQHRGESWGHTLRIA